MNHNTKWKLWEHVVYNCEDAGERRNDPDQYWIYVDANVQVCHAFVHYHQSVPPLDV